jgi:hypothetical protein
MSVRICTQRAQRTQRGENERGDGGEERRREEERKRKEKKGKERRGGEGKGREGKGREGKGKGKGKYTILVCESVYNYIYAHTRTYCHTLMM